MIFVFFIQIKLKIETKKTLSTLDFYLLFQIKNNKKKIFFFIKCNYLINQRLRLISMCVLYFTNIQKEKNHKGATPKFLLILETRKKIKLIN